MLSWRGRFLGSVVLLFVWLSAIALSLSAAPISGSFQVDMVFASANCGVDEDGDTFVDEDPPNDLDDDGDTLIDEDDCDKVGDTVLKLEVDLALKMTISGLEIGSATVFTLKGLEFQAVTLSATIGALSVKDTFIFAPSITEIEFTRTNSTLALRYCVSASAPASVTPPFRECPYPDSRLYWLIEDVGFYHPAVANLTLARIFDATGMLDALLVFRKKVVDLSLNIAGLTLSTRALFANLGTDDAPTFSVGLIAAVEGQTTSGVTIRAETWLGARQGMECFAECKPIERIYNGIVANSLTIQEEKIFIRNLTIAGVTFNVRAEFQFYDDPRSTCTNPGICYVEINSRARLQPLNLTVNNTLRLGPSLEPRFDFLVTSLKFGDVSVSAVWYFFLTDTNTWEAQLIEFISTFDPPGVTVTSDLKLCTGPTMPLCTGGVLKHIVFLSAALGNFTFDAQATFIGLISNFYQLWVDVAWKAGVVEFTSSLVVSAEFVNAVALGIKVRF